MQVECTGAENALVHRHLSQRLELSVTERLALRGENERAMG